MSYIAQQVNKSSHVIYIKIEPRAQITITSDYKINDLIIHITRETSQNNNLMIS